MLLLLVCLNFGVLVLGGGGLLFIVDYLCAIVLFTYVVDDLLGFDW